MNEFVETYRGEALAWEADELGHLNMRYYFARAGQARASFFAHLNLPNIYKARNHSTVTVDDQHINYIAEIRPGRGMIVKTGVLEIGQATMTLVHVITATPDTLSATIVEKISHISSRTQKPFSWPQRVRDAATKLKRNLPNEAQTRNIDLSEKLTTPSVKKANKLDLPVIGRGAFMPTECDAFGHVRPSDLIGRISDSVKHLAFAWPDIDFDDQERISGALLEGRVIHYNRPVAGDVYVIRSGMRTANTYVRELCHWILDPVSGKCWASMIGVPCKFDLLKRRLVKNTEPELAMLAKHFVKGLGP